MNKVIAIVGPTASGKTKLAIDMAKNFDTEIISADSRLVYKGFDIATAKPTKTERNEIKHYMIDIIEPEYDYSVADFVDEAEKYINTLLAKGKTPIVVGGTGLYLRILLENYKLPRLEADLSLRNELEQKTADELYNELIKVDPISAECIHPNNKVRIIRALEVYKLLKIPFSKIDKKQKPKYDVNWIMPNIESRESLYNKINNRVDMMIENGLIDETKFLLNKHGRIKNFINTIGYSEILSYLDGDISLDIAIDLIKQNTRRYAKRQLTWFRKNPNLEFNL